MTNIEYLNQLKFENARLQDKINSLQMRNEMAMDHITKLEREKQNLQLEIARLKDKRWAATSRVVEQFKTNVTEKSNADLLPLGRTNMIVGAK